MGSPRGRKEDRMTGWRRATTTVLALGGLAATLPGCLVAVGSTLPADSGDRVDRLEKRIQAAEQKLGIPSPAEAPK